MIFKKFLAVILSVVLLIGVLPMSTINLTASAETSGYYTYTVLSGKATITDVNTKISGDITVPSSLGGYPVTSIGNCAFYYCSRLTSITIPNSVTSIGNSAFFYCISLSSITIPNSVTSIGDSAFYDCSSLRSITIPYSVTSIGDMAFRYCSSLTSITIPNSVTSIGYGAFFECDSLTSITIPNSVTSIGDETFYMCNSLTSITIPNSVTSIGDETFYRCNSLTSITIPDSVTSIGNSAFFYCSSLTSITIPNSVTSIGERAFSGCSNLTLFCVANSYAEKYAKNNSLNYITENIVENLLNQDTKNALVETDTMFKELAVNYPLYLKNDAIDNYNNLINEFCYEAIDDYSNFEIVRLAVMEGFFNGSEVVTSQLLSFLGKNSKGYQWIEEATLKLLQDIESQDMVIYDVWDTINTSYENFDFVYGATETVSKLNLAQSIAKSSKNLNSEQAVKLVNEAYKKVGELNFSKAFDATGKAFDLVDITIYACQLYDAEIEIINRLLELTPTNNTLYKGLTMIKKAREIDPVAYAVSAFIKKEIASGLGKLIANVGKYATSKLFKLDISITLAVVQLSMDVFYDYLYTGVKAGDYTKAIILNEFYLTISTALTEKYTTILNAYNDKKTIEQKVLDDYKFLWEARTAALGTYADTCTIIAKDDTIKSLLESYDTNKKSLVGFDNYVKLCIIELNNAIAEGAVTCKHYRSYPTRIVQSNCSSDGYTINYCLTCCKEYVSEVDAKDGHKYITTVVNPTCENQGYTNYTCKNCRYSFNTNYSSAKGHTLTESKFNSTCLTKGYTIHTCSTCGYTYKDNYQDVLGHSYSGWITEYDSTCSEYGSVYNDCTVCSDRIYAKITKKEHTPSSDLTIDIEPTENTDGAISHHCNLCDKPTDASITLPYLKISDTVLKLNSSYKLLYKVDKNFFSANGYSNPYVSFKVNDIETNVYNYTEDGDFLIFEYGLSLSNINQKITSRLFADFGDKTYNSAEVTATTKQIGEKYCDINNDAKVNIMDYINLQKHIIGDKNITINPNANPDNSDGLDLLDLVFLKKFLLFL